MRAVGAKLVPVLALVGLAGAAAAVGSSAGYAVGTRVSVRADAPAAGWAGELQLASDDTWEPTVAADPGAPYVYTMYNRFGPACGKSCPNPAMMVRVSSDGGRTWGPETQICRCKTQGQWDPVLATTASGAVYATWMNYNAIAFSKSTNHGATWTAPVTVSGNSWADKPWIGTSASGADIYIAYESRSVLYVTSSHDAGATWSAPLALNVDRSVYRFPNGLVVLPNSTAVLATSKYPGSSKQATGTVDIDVWRSSDGGASWSRVTVDHVSTGVDYFTSSTTTIAGDPNGTLVLEYSGALTVGGNGHLWVRRSTDGGVSWGPASELGSRTANASFPAAASGGANDFRITWMDNRSGAWNIWYSTSADGGQTWSVGADISDASGGAAYKTAAGFASPYGDYDGLAVTNAGKTVSIAGEGTSYKGPGSIWINRQS